MPKFYVTTAIDYANGEPHLGHALEKIGADVIARHRRLRGDAVHFVMGMDEHGQKVAQSAEKGGAEPQAWVDGLAASFDAQWRALLCSHDDWMRTTQPRHFRAVTALLEAIRARHPEDLFVGEYEGLYCVGCEEFKQESQLVGGRCIEHPHLELVRTRESNHFFRLSRWRDQVLHLIRSGEFRVEPEIRRNEVLRVLEDGLQDISVSRARIPWGIPFPGDPEQTVYVWFDALINYLSATGYPDGDWERLWPAELHVIGKGITRFHCIIWPAMLLAAGVPLPRMVWAHGYVQWEGAKVSKSAGAAVSLADVAARHGPDALRYYLMREVGFENDGDFTWERFDARYTADLADGLGNLASRTLAMLEKYRGGVVPSHHTETTLDVAGRELARVVADRMDQLDLRGALEATWQLVSDANQFVQTSAPWTLAKQGDDARLDEVLASLTRGLYRLAIMTAAVMPGKAQQLWGDLGQAGDVADASWASLHDAPVASATARKGEGLFPKPVPPKA